VGNGKPLKKWELRRTAKRQNGSTPYYDLTGQAAKELQHLITFGDDDKEKKMVFRNL
jgi:hypothetical protein